MKIVVLLVLVAAAVSSAYAQCDSVEEKQMVSCAKNFMRRCDKATKKCLRERCASHTAECLMESFSNSTVKRQFQRTVMAGEPIDIPKYTHLVPYFEVTFSDIRVVRFDWMRLTAAIGDDKNSVNFNGVEVKLRLKWHRREVLTSRLVRNRVALLHTTYPEFTGTATATASGSRIECTYDTTKCNKVRCTLNLNNYKVTHTGHLGGLLIAHLPTETKPIVETKARRILRLATAKVLATMTC